MARASIRTLLPLDRFAAIAGIHPLHFNQVYVEDIAMPSTCDMPLFQYSWQQSDRSGREEIAQAVAQAEEAIINYAGFSPIPDWVSAERVMPPGVVVPEDTDFFFADLKGNYKSVFTQRGYLVTGGIESIALVGQAAVVYSDDDSDGYDETATITIATTVTDPDEIAIFFLGENTDQWEIRPITVTIAGGVATIVCRREQLVLPELAEALNPTAIDGLNDANFATAVDIYRHYTDPDTQVEFAWNETAGTFTTATGCMLVQNHRLGLARVEPATWNGSSFDAACIDRAPDRIRLWYYAGWPRKNHAMDPLWEKPIVYYALSLMDRPLCGCKSLEAFMKHWSEDYALSMSSPTSSVRYNFASRRLDCPLGTTRGAFKLWELIQKYRVR